MYETRWKPGEGNNAVVYLSPEGQEALNNRFVKTVPWNTFGRKNVGYLYAIMHGATVISSTFSPPLSMRICEGRPYIVTASLNRSSTVPA